MTHTHEANEGREGLAVTQEDREAAAQKLDGRYGLGHWLADEVRAGKHDSVGDVRMLAEHRTASLEAERSRASADAVGREAIARAIRQFMIVHADSDQLPAVQFMANREHLLADAIFALHRPASEPFGYWIEQKYAEPVLLRKPAYIPEPSELRTVTPLYAATPASDAAKDAEIARLHALAKANNDLVRHEASARAALAKRVVQLEAALEGVRDDLHNENRLNTHSIADVIWHSDIETTVDFIDAALNPEVSHG
jgi:hypothetical protein